MKIKITASVFALTAFTLLAQPSLPTTNSFIVPIANPYSGSWIYYTTNAASGLDYLNGASIPYVMAASNSLAAFSSGVTNGLATINYVNTATNGFVTASITNGFAPTGYVNAAIAPFATTNYVNAATNGFVTASVTNGLVGPSVTNGLVGLSVTNGLATINYVNTATNGFVTASITNGLAPIGYVNAAIAPFATTNYVNAATNGFVTTSVTNGLVGPSITNGLASTSYVSTTALSAGAGGNSDGQLITNLQNSTWGTTAAKPSGAAPPAAVYYYFTNGYPMFGIISTNN